MVVDLDGQFPLLLGHGECRALVRRLDEGGAADLQHRTRHHRVAHVKMTVDDDGWTSPRLKLLANRMVPGETARVAKTGGSDRLLV